MRKIYFRQYRYLIYVILLTLLTSSIQNAAHAHEPNERESCAKQNYPEQREPKSKDKNSHKQEHNHKHKHEHYQKSFAGAEQWAKKFDDPARDNWQMPEKVIESLTVKERGLIIDIGSGTGYFAVKLAESYPHCRILAVDIEPDMVSYLQARAKKLGLENLQSLVASSPAQLELDKDADLAIVVNTYHHLPGRVAYFAELEKIMARDSRLVIIDFDERSPEGPPKKHRISAETVIAELTESGFELSGNLDFLPYQYFLVFRPRANVE